MTTNKIILKKSSVTGKVPVASDLDYGELAINYADGKIYFKASDNSVKYFKDLATTALDDLSNVNAPSPTPGQVLQWNGTEWVNSSTNTAFNAYTRYYDGNGATSSFTIGSGLTAESILVFVGGISQTPLSDYTITGTTLTFSSPPPSGLKIVIKELTGHLLGYGATGPTGPSSDLTNIVGNLIPASDQLYDIGSPTRRWRTGYFSANTIDLGGTPISAQDGFLVVDGQSIGYGATGPTGPQGPAGPTGADSTRHTRR